MGIVIVDLSEENKTIVIDPKENKIERDEKTPEKGTCMWDQIPSLQVSHFLSE